MMNGELFEIGKEDFSIMVDYGIPIGEIYDRAVKLGRWSGPIEMQCAIPNGDDLKRHFRCYYAILQEDADLFDMREVFEFQRIIPADMLQLFSFIIGYVQTEVTMENPDPIVAAAEGSTWRCSHECLNEMAGIKWDPFYHDPGPCLHTESAPFEKGARFLSIRE